MARLMLVCSLAAIALSAYWTTNAFTVSPTMEGEDECPPCGSPTVTLLVGIFIGLVSSYLYGLKECVNELPKIKEIENLWEEKQLEITAKPGKYAHRDNMNSISTADFRKHMQEMTEFLIDYAHNPEKQKVVLDNKFGFIFDALPKNMPVTAHKYEAVFKDFRDTILPGLMHWQHPRFHGYFGGGFSYPDILSETLITGLGVNPFAWVGSPGFIELEMIVINWMGKAIGLDKSMYMQDEDVKKSTGGGIIGYSSSEVIANSMLASRSRILRELVDYNDPDRQQKEADLLPRLIAYSNMEAHSSIEKACKLAMVSYRAVRPETDDHGLTGEVLERAIKEDLAKGLIPFHVHGALGTTSSGAMDRLDELADVAKKYNCWIHVDAAFGGCAMICPEYRYLSKGIEKLDSINVNMHKWPWCSIPMTFFFCRHRAHVRAAFDVNPVYLQAANHDFPAVRHWGTQLSRRPLCLKAWFIMRCFGLEGLQKQVRQMVSNAETFRKLIEKDDRFVIVGKPVLSLVVFRLNAGTLEESNKHTKALSDYINRSTKLFMTYAKPLGTTDVIRMNMCHSLSLENDAVESYQVLSELTDEYLKQTASERSAAEKLVKSPILPLKNCALNGRELTLDKSALIEIPYTKSQLKKLRQIG